MASDNCVNVAHYLPDLLRGSTTNLHIRDTDGRKLRHNRLICAEQASRDVLKIGRYETWMDSSGRGAHNVSEHLLSRPFPRPLPGFPHRWTYIMWFACMRELRFWRTTYLFSFRSAIRKSRNSTHNAEQRAARLVYMCCTIRLDKMLPSSGGGLRSGLRLAAAFIVFTDHWTYRKIIFKGCSTY